MEKYLIVLIILFIVVGLFITITSKITCEKFRDDDRELRLLNRNIDLVNRSLNQITGFDNTLLNLID